MSISVLFYEISNKTLPRCWRAFCAIFTQTFVPFLVSVAFKIFSNRIFLVFLVFWKCLMMPFEMICTILMQTLLNLELLRPLRPSLYIRLWFCWNTLTMVIKPNFRASWNLFSWVYPKKYTILLLSCPKGSAQLHNWTWNLVELKIQKVSYLNRCRPQKSKEKAGHKLKCQHPVIFIHSLWFSIQCVQKIAFESRCLRAELIRPVWWMRATRHRFINIHIACSRMAMPWTKLPAS